MRQPPTGYFAVGRYRIYPVPAEWRQEFLDNATGLIFRSTSTTQPQFLEFWKGVGVWRPLSPYGTDVYSLVHDRHVPIQVSRDEAAVILRRLAPRRRLPE